MKKILLIILILLLIGVLAACNRRRTEPPDLEGTQSVEITEITSGNAAQRYARLTQWNYHPSYSFLLTSIEEQGDNLLLRGVLARDVLTPAEVETARSEGTIEINGETFIHTNVDIEGFMPRDRLYNARTGAEIYLVTAFFGEHEGDDPMYRMIKNDEQLHFHHFFKITGMYREVEVDKTTPIEIYRQVIEPREWGYLELFAPIETHAHVFSNYNEYYLPDGFPFDGSFIFIFENENCVFVRWLP